MKSNGIKADIIEKVKKGNTEARDIYALIVKDSAEKTIDLYDANLEEAFCKYHKNIEKIEGKPRLLRCSRGFLKFVFMQILRISPFPIVLLAKTKEISHETESFIHDFSSLPAPG